MTEKKTSLYDIAKEVELLDDLLMQNDGEIDSDSEELLNQVETLLEHKADGVVEFIEQQKNLIAIAGTRIKEFQEFKKSRENSINRIIEYTIMCMNKMDKKVINGNFHKISFRKPSVKVSITDEDKIPLEFLTVKSTTSINLNEIKKAIKTGEVVDGAELIDGNQTVSFGKRTN